MVEVAIPRGATVKNIKRFLDLAFEDTYHRGETPWVWTATNPASINRWPEGVFWEGRGGGGGWEGLWGPHAPKAKRW